MLWAVALNTMGASSISSILRKWWTFPSFWRLSMSLTADFSASWKEFVSPKSIGHYKVGLILSSRFLNNVYKGNPIVFLSIATSCPVIMSLRGPSGLNSLPIASTTEIPPSFFFNSTLPALLSWNKWTLRKLTFLRTCTHGVSSSSPPMSSVQVSIIFFISLGILYYSFFHTRASLEEVFKSHALSAFFSSPLSTFKAKFSLSRFNAYSVAIPLHTSYAINPT